MTRGSSTRRRSITAAVLASFWCGSVLAANTVEVEVDCDDSELASSAVPAPKFTVTVTEADVDGDQDTDISAPSSSLTDAVNAEEAALEDGTDVETRLPADAVRLPGISQENLPRYRRQMNRTDI
ncbi:MAG: hypothetical protein AAF351_11690 [Pseudomonadota bacterium]